MRVVSLLPSATEIVYAIGGEDQLCGVTFECDEPPEARTRHRVLVTGADTSGMSPADIDTYVRDKLSRGEDLYALAPGALEDLQPDLVLTQDLCRVCAVHTDTVEEALDALGCRADVVTLDPHSLEDILDSILIVGARLDLASSASRVVNDLRARLGRVAESVSDRPRPRVAVLEWTDPPFTAGHWIPDLVRAAGGEPVAHSGPGRSVGTSWDAIRDARPDVVFVAPCGYHLEGAAGLARQVLAELPEQAAVYAIDADGIIVRPGPRVVDGIEAMAAVIHPLRSIDVATDISARAESCRLIRG